MASGINATILNDFRLLLNDRVQVGSATVSTQTSMSSHSDELVLTRGRLDLSRCFYPSQRLWTSLSLRRRYTW